MDDYFDLGSHSRKVSTQSGAAQIWFDRGLNWCFGFNHEEAIACFEKALESDPGLSIAHWGIAYALGCNYNKPWEAFDETDFAASMEKARTHLDAALSGIENASASEAALIRALEKRHQAGTATPEEACRWNEDYAEAMRDVYQSHSRDLDVATLFAEALMNLTPWQLWDLPTGAIAEGAKTQEAADVLEKALLQDGAYAHPGLLHLYIHLWEMSPEPQRALKAGDALRNLVPDAGHLRHMPTHIDVLCGHYERVVSSNHDAVLADTAYLNRNGPLNFYSLYRCHNYHFKSYGAMFLGQFGPALEAAEEMNRTLPEELLKVPSPPMADWLEGFISIKQHVLIRFGWWDDIIAQDLPENQDLFSVTTAMIHYAKAVAYAASNRVAEAEAEAELFTAAYARVPDSRYIFNNTCRDILAIAEQMMMGEIAYRKGDHDLAFARLRKSVELDDTLPYDEPWGWMQPTRHALGALLLEQQRYEEAAAVYRDDLGLNPSIPRAVHHPDNVWSLHGYHECLTRLGRTEEAALVKQKLDIANGRTDIPVKSSCFCKTGSA